MKLRNLIETNRQKSFFRERLQNAQQFSYEWEGKDIRYKIWDDYLKKSQLEKNDRKEEKHENH